MWNRRPRLFNLAPRLRRQHSRGRLCHMDLALHRHFTVMHESLWLERIRAPSVGGAVEERELRHPQVGATIGDERKLLQGSR